MSITGLPRRAVNGCLGEGGVNLVSAQRLVMNNTKPLFIIGLHLASKPVPNARVHACINLAVAPSKEFPSALLLHAVWSHEDQGAIHELVRLKVRSFAPT